MTETPFDIFEPDRRPREQSAREKEHDDKISYSRYSGAIKFPCWDCITERQNLRNATVIRHEGGATSYLCARHAQTRRDAEALRELARKDDGRNQKNAKRRRS